MNNNIPQGYKDSPLGVIPADWEVKRLGEIGNVISGLTYSPDDIRTDGILVLRSSNVQNGKLSFNDNIYVNVNKYNSVKTGDILICVRNGSRNLIGKNAIITQEVEGVAFGAFMSIYRSVNNSYLYHLFNTDYYNKEVYKNLGATINSINGSDLKNFCFPIPQPAEQERIAEVLGCWDVAIEKQGALVEKLTERKRALMQQLLTARKRLPNFTAPWQTVNFDYIYNVIPVKKYQIQKSKYNEIGTYPIVDQGKSLIVAYTDIDNCFVDIPAIIFGDHTRIIKWIDFNFMIGADGVQVLHAKKILNLKFGYYILQNTPIPNLGYSRHMRELKLMNFDIPNDIAEQQAIANILTKADKEIEIAKKKLATLRTQKQGLMQQLLTGKKRLPMP